MLFPLRYLMWTQTTDKARANASERQGKLHRMHYREGVILYIPYERHRAMGSIWHPAAEGKPEYRGTTPLDRMVSKWRRRKARHNVALRRKARHNVHRGTNVYSLEVLAVRFFRTHN